MAILTALCRLGRDAEVRQTSGGDSVANLALAYNLSRKGSDGKYPSVWVDGSLWGQRAEKLAQYLVKGQQVVVTLKDPQVKTFKKRDNTTGFTLAAEVIDLQFAGPPPEKKEEPKREPARAPATSGGGAGFEDDDIPF